MPCPVRADKGLMLAPHSFPGYLPWRGSYPRHPAWLHQALWDRGFLHQYCPLQFPDRGNGLGSSSAKPVAGELGKRLSTSTLLSSKILHFFLPVAALPRDALYSLISSLSVCTLRSYPIEHQKKKKKKRVQALLLAHTCPQSQFLLFLTPKESTQTTELSPEVGNFFEKWWLS